MRNIAFIGMLLTAAFMAGWFKVQRDGEHTLIEIDRAAIREDARHAIEKSREIIDRSEQASGSPAGADTSAPWAPQSPWTAVPQSPYPPYSQAGYPTTSPYRSDSNYSQGPPDRYSDYPSNQAPAYAPAPYAIPDYSQPGTPAAPVRYPSQSPPSIQIPSYPRR